MAKIIEKGKDVDWISEEMTCESCRTIFQLEAKDILAANLYNEWCDYDCPGCGVHDRVRAPLHVGQYAEERREEREK